MGNAKNGRGCYIDTQEAKGTFEAAFAGVETQLMFPDPASEANFLPPDLFETLVSKRADIKSTKLNYTRTFDLAMIPDSAEKITDKSYTTVMSNIDTKVHHCNALRIRRKL